MTLEEEFVYYFEKLYEISDKAGWGDDPVSYGRAKEIIMSIKMKHIISPTLSGADGFFEGKPKEYKTTIGNSGFLYNGLSNYDNWEDQFTYLRDNKICKYDEHFFALFDRKKGEIKEIWCLTGEKVFEILIPKIKRKYDKMMKTTLRDGRLGTSLTFNEVKANGKQIY